MDNLGKLWLAELGSYVIDHKKLKIIFDVLTRRGLGTPYGNKDHGQHLCR